MRSGITLFDLADNASSDVLFVSSQVPVLDGEIVISKIGLQTEQVVKDIVKILRSASCRLELDVKVNAWLDGLISPALISCFNVISANNSQSVRYTLVSLLIRYKGRNGPNRL